ncbi:hypothetical protein FQN53_000006 [Emmonsiellopsis sp. PD_33]|nr:hypothetical protein FQN53_000006 [Emmonsiellopsis sp. PD_33]
MASSRLPITSDLVSTLASSLHNTTVVTPSSPGYEESIARWSDAAVKQAGVVLLPVTSEDISIAVKFVQEHHIDLAVRGGGHSVSGTSSSDGGVVIDLSRMRAVTVDIDKKIITAQGGALWADVDTAAAEHGLATVGGTVNHTGIGGLTLGGGYGWLSGRHGMVVDNLLSATVVLADGQIVTASSTENSDLFWALRGAGHNFGVVVEFQYRAHEQPNEVFAGVVSFTIDKLEAVIEVLNSLMEEPDANTAAVCGIGIPPLAPGVMVSVMPFYNGLEEEAKKVFAPLFALGPAVDQTTMIPYAALNGVINGMAGHGGRKTLKGIFFAKPLRPAFIRSVVENFEKKLQTDPDLAASMILLEFLDMRKVCEVPISSTAVVNRSTQTLNSVLFFRWEDPSKDAQHREYSRQLQNMFREELEARMQDGNLAADTVPQYLNYAEPGDSAVPEIFGGNKAKLENLKAQYDPQSLFSKMNAITPVAGVVG